ncbi:hypothetical protein AVEN_34697-1 [Araneus ventricosus]|uniref:Uncharacterized protein n=1 Tax=Araneus ventricosus TaxID=182803 RepID=A0A4Y2AZM6_ARAVE|nr:hypothetical protein AVEN_34697-1 [Araneus ventricosus]
MRALTTSLPRDMMIAGQWNPTESGANLELKRCPTLRQLPRRGIYASLSTDWIFKRHPVISHSWREAIRSFLFFDFVAPNQLPPTFREV